MIAFNSLLEYAYGNGAASAARIFLAGVLLHVWIPSKLYINKLSKLHVQLLAVCGRSSEFRFRICSCAA